MTEKITILDPWEFELGGRIWGKPPNGEGIITSPVVARNPEVNIIQTRSGSLYQLGTHGGDSHAPHLIWDDRGYIVGDCRTIPRISPGNLEAVSCHPDASDAIES